MFEHPIAHFSHITQLHDIKILTDGKSGIPFNGGYLSILDACQCLKEPEQQSSSREAAGKLRNTDA